MAKIRPDDGHGGLYENPGRKDIKLDFGRFILPARAPSVVRRERPVVMLMVVGKFERLRAIGTDRAKKRPNRTGTAE